MEKAGSKKMISIEEFEFLLNRTENWLKEVNEIIKNENDPKKRKELTNKIDIFEIPEKIDEKEIEKLVIEKGFYNKYDDIPKKLLFAFIELGEASDAWKKGKEEKNIAEELIDSIFYILDTSRLACPTINMDSMFSWKLEKNKKREYQYGEGHRNSKK